MSEFLLQREQYISSIIVDKDLIIDDIYLDYTIEDQHYRLTACHRPFVHVLQQNEKILSIPSNNWEWFKSLFKLKHKVKNYYLTEHVKFPNYKFPEKLGEARVFTQIDMDITYDDTNDYNPST